MSVSSLSRVGWLSLMLSLASKATAFNSSPREPVAMLHREVLRETYTEGYGGGKYSQMSLTSTRLQYRDGNEDSSEIKKPSESTKWWTTLFSSQPGPENDQDSVDEYLEFLERRYNRIHEEKEEKPFSAIDWLLQGSPKKGEILASQQQKEDALYVLGVAGLASQKLLQKHPQLNAESSEETETLREATRIPIDALDALATEETTFGHMVIKRVLVPFVRFLYIVQQRKQIFVKTQGRKAKQLVSKATRGTLRIILYGPIQVSKALLELGGGKRNILGTLTFASTMLVLISPFVKAAVTEGSVGP